MTIKHSALAATALGGSAAAAFAGFGRFGSRIAFAPEGGAGDGGAAGGEGEGNKGAGGDAGSKGGEGTPPANAGGAGEGGNKPSDAEAKLIKDLGKAKDRLKLFEGVDPEEFRRLKADADAAAAAKTEKERQDAEARGEFDRVKASMVEQHNTALADLQAKLDAAEADKGKLARDIDELTIGASFGSSKFVSEDLVLPVSKARTLFGAHFVREDGKTVAYDKPAGAAERTKLVDAKGEPLGFEDALRRIVEADADKDRLLRAKGKPGAGSGTTDARTTRTPAGGGEVRGTARILAALSKKQAA